jgi:hypothetical protein
MKANAPALATELATALTDFLKTKDVDRDRLARELGVHSRQLNFWLSADRNIPAYILPDLCRCLEQHLCLPGHKPTAVERDAAFIALDVLERNVGRMAFRLPTPGYVEASDMAAVQRLVKEVGEALAKMGETLEDGVVEDHEMPSTLKEIDDVIHECARLKHWLIERNKADNQKRIMARRTESSPSA